ncbi:hypothetical protein [Streptomyces sp. AMCC400023]|uniref:hypothetical protein n=1 Tax=Streptomyces sp. AMCC400023 TaxID=2056258 RepID=UPI001F236379|nr:hypothetical protein [Streptomyces sp. AMCC400023]
MGDTFSGKWNRPDQSGNGHTMRELQDRASFDNQPQTGCGALLLLCILATAAAIGLALT